MRTKTESWLWCAVCVLVAIMAWHNMQVQTPEEMQREYDGYRMCMAMASTVQCQMTPQDFVNYYDLKYVLEALALENENER